METPSSFLSSIYHDTLSVTLSPGCNTCSLLLMGNQITAVQCHRDTMGFMEQDLAPEYYHHYRPDARQIICSVVHLMSSFLRGLLFRSVLGLSAGACVSGLVMVTVASGHAAQLATGAEQCSPILTPMYMYNDIHSSFEKMFLKTVCQLVIDKC